MAPGVPESAEVETAIQNYSSLRRESRASSLPGWKSVDRLDNSSKNTHTQYSSLEESSASEKKNLPKKIKGTF